jgi:hypothetical protein
LKRGGFRVTQKEMDQARDYAKEINRSGKVGRDTEIEVFVLGAHLEESLSEAKQGNISVRPMVYDLELRRAEARTFNLQKKLKVVEPPIPLDRELEEVLGSGDDLFKTFA